MSRPAPTRNTWRRLRKNVGACIGLVIIILSVIIAIFAYYIAPDNSPNANRMIVEVGGRKPGHSQLFFKLPKTQVIERPSALSILIWGEPDKFQYIPITKSRLTRDSIILQKYIDEDVSEPLAFSHRHAGIADTSNAREESIETITFRLGSDQFGRDILSRLIVGIRVSLGVGLVTVIISLTIGVLLGSLAGYFGGRIDDFIMWFINIIWSIPTLLLVFAMTLMLGKGFWQVFVSIGLTMWVNVARIIRGQVLAVREMEYIEAARALGYRNGRIIFKHILPNVWGPVMVVAASNFASAIVIEAGLSFLGVGVQPPQPSWGLMIKENYNFIITQNPMLALAPGFAIMVLVLAFNMLGNGLRDALQVKE
jgi:peptide/nickel transport system permease protein